MLILLLGGNSDCNNNVSPNKKMEDGKVSLYENTEDLKGDKTTLWLECGHLRNGNIVNFSGRMEKQLDEKTMSVGSVTS